MVVDTFAEPRAIHVVDETGNPTKGTTTIGGATPVLGTARRVENCQIAVCMPNTSSKGHALIDCALSMPHSWPADRDRCAESRVPDDCEFATQPQLATSAALWMRMCRLGGWPATTWTAPTRTCEPWCWTTGSDAVWQSGATVGSPPTAGTGPPPISLPPFPAESWQQLSAGTGIKGDRLRS